MTQKGIVRLAGTLLLALLALIVVISDLWAIPQAGPQPPGQAGTPASNQGAAHQPPAELKNIQVLKGMSRPEVFTLMREWSTALGVQCNYCHIMPFEAETPRKAVARLMQRDYVAGMKRKDGKSVSCQDCHQGHANFLRVRPFEGVVGKDLPHTRVLSDTDKGKVMQIMAGFTQALGVNCTACHVADFEEETVRKEIARFMMTEFTQKLTKADGTAVSCADCHQGHARPLTVLPFPRREERQPGNQPAPERRNS